MEAVVSRSIYNPFYQDYFEYIKQGIMDYMANLIGVESGTKALSGETNNDGITSREWAVFSLFFGWGSFIFGAAALGIALSDGTGTSAGTLAVYATIAAFSIGLAAVFISSASDGAYSVLSLGALFLSILATVFGFMSLPGANIVAKAVGLIGMGLGGIGIYFALLSLGVI